MDGWMGRWMERRKGVRLMMMFGIRNEPMRDAGEDLGLDILLDICPRFSILRCLVREKFS